MQNATKAATFSRPKDWIGLRQMSRSLYGLYALSTINDIWQQLGFTAPHTARKQSLFVCPSVRYTGALFEMATIGLKGEIDAV